ncbi:ribosome recycling factor [Biscogniauxia marginata]|nr:ribosome recycling factor [Biscogniauxia marginata]
MRNTAARTLLRRGISRPELARTYDVVPRAGFASAAAATCNRPVGIYTSQRPQPRPQSHTSTTPLNLPSPLNGARAFHATPAAHKKGGKSRDPEPKGAPPSSKPGAEDDHDGGSKHPTPDPSEPLEFADVLSRASKHDAHYREVLKRLRSGGRFNADAIGALQVQPDRKSGTTYPLRELAQVIPRGGRTVSLLVHEEGYIRAVMSAVQASEDFNQQPQRSPDNELELVLKVEPESREDNVKRARAACNEWRDRVRSVRQRRDKLHATWQKEKLIVPDLKKAADKALDKIIKAKMAEIDAAEKEALKAAESGK